MSTVTDTPAVANARRGFDSLEDETHLDGLPVRGELPPWLKGSLIRTGPAKWEVGDRTMNHWFDGFAMLHRFAGMPLRRLIFLSSLVLTVAALSPAAALGAAKGTDRPVKGTSTATVIVNLATGTGTVDGTGQGTHGGKGTFHDDIMSTTFTGPNTFTSTGTTTVLAANGDKLFATTAGTGTLTSTGNELTTVNTITGGTGRFADASGTITVTSVGVTVSIVGAIVTLTLTNTSEGQISY